MYYLENTLQLLSLQTYMIEWPLSKSKMVHWEKIYGYWVDDNTSWFLPFYMYCSIVTNKV